MLHACQNLAEAATERRSRKGGAIVTERRDEALACDPPVRGRSVLAGDGKHESAAHGLWGAGEPCLRTSV